MKFISWNVNGLRACIQKGFLDQFNSLDADFFCLQETKLSEGQLELSMPGYFQYWCYAEKKGYSGTAIFTKHEPLNVSYGIGQEALDNEGRVITLEYQEFFLVNCYTPNAQRGLARIDHRMNWDTALRTYLQDLDKVKPVVICGDLNVAHKEIDLKNPAANRGNAGFSDEERGSFQATLDAGFTDTFRHLYPDVTGRYSWWSYMFKARENNAGWRIDYFLVSDRLKNEIQKADIYNDILGSDHCPVMLELDTLVNGGIWSPTAGTASVIEKEEPKKKKASKASPVNGKALALFCLLLSAVLTLAGLPTLLDLIQPNIPFLEPSQPSELYFVVDVLPQPFRRVPNVVNIDGTIVEGFYNNRLSDDNGTYYLRTSSYNKMANSSFWLRVTLTELGLQAYQPEWKIMLHVGSSLDPDHPDSATAYSQTIVPYYTDANLTQLGGWLIWGELSHSSICFVSVDDKSFFFDLYVKSDEDIGIAPEPDMPAEFFTVTQFYQLPKILYWSADYLSSQLYIGFSVNDVDYWTDIKDGRYSLYDSDFCIQISLTASAMGYLQGKDYTLSFLPTLQEGTTESNALIPYYLDQRRKQVAGWFLCGSSNTTQINDLTLIWDNMTYTMPEAIAITPIYDISELEELETDTLVKLVLSDYKVFQIMTGKSTSDLEERLTQACKNQPALSHLIQRPDGVECLMNASWTELNVNWNCRKLVHLLLSTSYLREKMQPFEEVLFLLNSYPACPYSPENLNVESNVDLTSIDTQTLIANMLLKSTTWDTYFSQCSSYEVREYMYRYLRIYNPIARELEKRDDAEQYLLEFVPSDGTMNLASYLLELWPVMQELNGEILYQTEWSTN